MKFKKEDKINRKRPRLPLNCLRISVSCLVVLLLVSLSFAQNLPRPLNVIRITPHPSDPNILYALDESHGVFKSVDQGKTWVLKNTGLDQLPEILPLSLHPEFFTELAMGKTNPNVLFVVKNWLIYRSEDGAETWTFSGKGAESFVYGSNQATYFINEVVTHPTDAQVVYAGTIVGGATGGVFQSVDGGRTWTPLAGDTVPGSGLGNDAAPIVIDPLDPLRMYAGGVHSIFFRSTDAGLHWERRDPLVGVEGAIWPDDGLGVNPANPAEVFVGVGIFAPFQAVKSFVSKDFGASWTELPQLKGAIRSLQFAPSFPNRVYAVVRTRPEFHPSTPGSFLLFRSDDSGVTWAELGSSPFEFQSLAVDPFDPNHLYVGTQHRGVIQSFDGGDSFITK